jgi:hypothetical protein
VLEANSQGAGGRSSDQYARRIASKRGLSITKEKIISELRSVRKLTSPSMKMPRCTPRTVFSGLEALCFFRLS